MGDEVNSILLAKQVTYTRAVPPKIALPIMEEASLEEDPNLQKLWNHLLANAMTPTFNDEIRYGYIDMIKGITGVEAKPLNELYNALQSENQLTPLHSITNITFKKEDVIAVLNISLDEYAISANNLMRLQLIAPAILKAGAKLGAENIAIYKGIDIITMTPLSVKFVEACLR
jgi:hypothetical protein